MKRSFLFVVASLAIALSSCTTPVRDDVSPPAAKRATGFVGRASVTGQFDVPVKLLSGDAPLYPLGRMLQRESGSAVLEYRIDREGRPQDIRVISATNKYFGSHSVIAVRTWKFSPALKGGVPVEVKLIQPFVFSVDEFR